MSMGTSEHDVFQRLIADITSAINCCLELEKMRNDHRWHKVAEGLKHMRDLMYHFTHKARSN